MGSCHQSNTMQFYEFWAEVDPCMSGQTEGPKFQSMLCHLESLAHVHRLRSQKITSLLVNRETGFVAVEDVMCAVWPQSTAMEKAALWACMVEEHEIRQHVPIAEPPLLPQEEIESLTRVFAELDKSGTGRVSFQAP